MSAIPVTLFTGFLGAGKTTLINRLLRLGDLAGLAVIVNEFGAIDLDSGLIEAVSADGIVELSNGCVCCSARGALFDRLAELAAPPPGRTAPDRILIETTGIADPAPILAGLWSDPELAARLRIDAVVSVVDRIAGLDHLAQRAEARRQVVLADVIVLTKGDAGSENRDDALDAAIGSLNATAERLNADDPAFDPRALIGRSHDKGTPASGAHKRGMQNPAARSDTTTENAHGHAHGAITSVALTGGTMAPATLAAFCDRMADAHGRRLLRLKGLVRCPIDPGRPLLVQMALGHWPEPLRLADWPAGTPRSTRLMAIGDDLDARAVNDLFSAYAGTTAIDAPDRAAIEDNPLSIPGLRLG